MKFYKDLLVEDEKSYSFNHEAFNKLSNYAKEQFFKEYKEFVLENCEDFQMFDEWLNRPLDYAVDGDIDELEYLADRYNLKNLEKAIEEDGWIGDVFESEEDFQEYVDGQKEPFFDAITCCGEYIQLAFQSSDYYNMYLFIEPVREEHQHRAYSFFNTTSHYWKDTDDTLFESEEEEMLYKIADEKIYSIHPEDVYPEFIELGLEILAKYPNADMSSVAEWVDEHLNSYSYHLNCKLIDNCLVAAVDDNIVQMELVA